MAFFSPTLKDKKVAPLPIVREEPVYSVTPQTPPSSDYSNRNMYRPGFTANDPKNAAAAARRAATRALMPNPNVAPRAAAGVGSWGANAPVPRPTIVIPKGGSRRHRRKTHRRSRNTRRR